LLESLKFSNRLPNACVLHKVAKRQQSRRHLRLRQ
jgi:hypothetical protein